MDAQQWNKENLTAALESIRVMEEKGLEIRETYQAGSGWLDGCRPVHFIAYSPLTGGPEIFQWDGRGWMRLSSSGGWVRGEDDLLAATAQSIDFQPDSVDRFGFKTQDGKRDYELKRIALGAAPAQKGA